MPRQISSASSVPMIGSTVVNTMLSLENVHSVEHADFARALAAAEIGDEGSARLIDSFARKMKTTHCMRLKHAIMILSQMANMKTPWRGTTCTLVFIHVGSHRSGCRAPVQTSMCLGNWPKHLSWQRVKISH